MEQLQQVGLSRETVYITSAVRSRPFSVKRSRLQNGERVTKFPNRTPTKEEIKILHLCLIGKSLFANLN